MLTTQGTQSAMVDAKKGRVLAVLVADPASGADGKKWARGRVEGKAKTDGGAPKLRDGYELYDVTLVDSGTRSIE